MVHLPAEIIDNVLGHLIEYKEPEYFPFANQDHSHCGSVLWSDIICTDQDAAHGRQITAHRAIHSLRLVSHEWNRGVAPFFSKHTTWNVRLDSKESLQRALRCVAKRSDRLTPVNEIVRRLMIQPGKACSSDFGVADGKLDVQPCLLELFGILNYVETFILSFPSGTSNFNFERTNEIVESVRRGFMQPNILSCIIDIQLRVPGTYHAGRILSAAVGEKQAQLAHLLVEIIDASGLAGSRDYLDEPFMEPEDWDGTVEESDVDDMSEESDTDNKSEERDVDSKHEQSDGDDGDNEFGNSKTSGESDHDAELTWAERHYPRSVLQRRYPNRRNQQELWDFISLCTHLETLSIQGTHYLDLHENIWEMGPNFRGLRVLHLGRVYAGFSSILPLLQPAGHCSNSQLQKIILNDVKVPEDGGMWGELAEYLLTNCPDLNLVYFYNLSYFDDCGRGAGLSAPSDSILIDSSDNDDLKPIEAVLRKMAKSYGDHESRPYWLREAMWSRGLDDDDGEE